MIVLETRLINIAMGLYELQSQTADDMHNHDSFYQLCIPVYGQPKMQFNDQLKNLSPYDVSMVSPADYHRNYADQGNIRLMIVSIKKEFLEQFYEEKVGRKTSGIEFSPWGIRNGQGLAKLVEQQMKQTILSPISQIEMEEFEQTMIDKILTVQKGSHSIYWGNDCRNYEHPLINRVIEFIRDQYNENLTLMKIAEETGMSKTHLTRLFREELGTSVSTYIMKVRLKEAETLLLQKSKNMTEISFEVGFGSLSTFERAFKKGYGITPLQFRNMNKTS